MLCVSAQFYLFVCFIYYDKCIVFWEVEMVHVTREEQVEEHNMESSWSILR